MRRTSDEVKRRGHVLASLMFNGSPAQSAESGRFDNGCRQENTTQKESELLIDSNKDGEKNMFFEFTDEDLSNANFKPVAPGEYEAVVRKVEMKGEQMMLTFRNAEDDTFLCNDFIYITAQGRSSASRKLITLGLEKGSSGKYTVGDSGENLIGLSAVLTLTHAKNPNYMQPDYHAKNHGYQSI